MDTTTTSINVPLEMPTVLQASGRATLPGQQDCVAQLAQMNHLRQSEQNYAQHQFNLRMQILRNREGLNAPLKMGMELFAARKIGRLPFLKSSKIMEDVLLGRDEMIDFEDYLGSPDFNESSWVQPHIIMEKSLGIL